MGICELTPTVGMSSEVIIPTSNDGLLDEWDSKKIGVVRRLVHLEGNHRLIHKYAQFQLFLTKTKTIAVQ
jgi:hypothetical protein